MSDRKPSPRATSPSSSGPVKTTITLPGDAVAVMHQLAEARNVSFAEVVRRALTMDKYLSDARKDGCRILVEDPDKVLKEILIF